LAPYLRLDQIGDELSKHGEVEVYGHSVEGRELWTVEIGAGDDVVFVTAAIHGIEYIGVATALEVLCQGSPDGVRLRICPVLNPDGYARTWERGGDAPVAALRKNSRGVDLNRNFPMPWGGRPSRMPGSGSGEPEAATYRGEAPLSEPETAALVDLLQRTRPVASANLHSFMGTLISPKVLHRPDWVRYSALARAFRRGQGSGLGYPRLATPVFDVFTGELEDYQHHVLGCWAMCVECFSLPETFAQHLRAPTSFWRFNPRSPHEVAQRDARGVRSLLATAAASERPPVRSGASRSLPSW